MAGPLLPIHKDYYNQYKKTAKILLNARVDINTQGGHYRTTPQAASFNREEMVATILLNALPNMDL